LTNNIAKLEEEIYACSFVRKNMQFISFWICCVSGLYY